MAKAINSVLLTVVKTDVFVCVVIITRTQHLIAFLFTRHAFPSRFHGCSFKAFVIQFGLTTA